MRSTRLRSAALVVAAQLLSLAGPAASSSASLPGGLGDPGLRAGDTTPPQVLLAPDREPDGAAGWYTAPVSVTVSVTDDLPSGGGVASVAYELSGASTGSGTLPPSGGIVPVSREGATTVTVTATDAAGNAGSATAELRVDLRSPAVDLNGLSDDVLLRQGAVQPLMYACFDTGSGVAACDAPLARGDLLPTGVLGDFEVSVTARDIAGRVLTRTLRYLVSDRLHFASEAGLTGTPRVGGTLTMVPAIARERQLGSLPCQWRRDGFQGPPS
ncbi:hypothetical protein [Brevundimonas sp.]|uniref:hypothetical protein n=1 Tax=Brevundimonas sp. TaxID=1871086 RepID=UPI002ED97393